MKPRIHAHIGTLRQLEILLAVYETGSIKGAAEELYLTQSTISMQMKKLSEAIDMPIFEKVGRQRRTTDAGLALIRTAREVLGQFSQLEETLADLRGIKAGTLRLAVVNSAKYFIPHLLGPFCQRYPAVQVKFRIGNRQQIITRLEDGLDDLYIFSHPPEDQEIEISEFLPNPLVAIVSNQHRFAQQKSISLEEFVKEPFIVRERGSGTRHAIEAHLRPANLSFRARMTIESNEAIKHAVISNLGVAIISAHALTFENRTGLTQVNVTGLPISAQWYLIKHRQRKLSPLTQTFMDYLEDEGRSLMLKELEAG